MKIGKTFIAVLAAMVFLCSLTYAETPTGKNQGASPRLLTPQNSALILIDHQPQMAFATRSIDGQTLVNNVTGLAKSAKIFLSSYSGKPPDEALRFALPHYAMAFLTTAVGAFGSFLSGFAVLGILTVLSIAQILYSLRYLPDPKAAN